MNRDRALQFMIFAIVLVGSFLVYATMLDGVYINKVYTSHDEEMRTLKSEYCRGEMVTATWSLCKVKNVPVTISWSLVNSTITSFTPRSGNLEEGCYDRAFDVQAIPQTAEIGGKYHFDGSVTYKTLGGEASIHRKTNEFTVVECEN